MIALVTVTFNSEHVIEDFLRCAEQLDDDVRLYAIDNASTDETVDILHREHDLDLVVLEQEQNLGIAVGNNIGIRRAILDGAEWIVLINNDTTFDTTLTRDLVATAGRAKAQIVVPSIRYHDRPDLVWFEAARYDTWRGSIPVVLDPAPPDTIVPIECANTCCALVHCSVFDRVGLMDEQYFVYWDDTDFFLRSDRAGIPMVLNSGIILLHKVSSLTGGGDSDFSQRERIKNRTYYVRKHHRGWQLSLGLLFTGVNIGRLVIVGPGRVPRLRMLTRAFIDGARIPVVR